MAHGCGQNKSNFTSNNFSCLFIIWLGIICIDWFVDVFAFLVNVLERFLLFDVFIKLEVVYLVVLV